MVSIGLERPHFFIPFLVVLTSLGLWLDSLGGLGWQITLSVVAWVVLIAACVSLGPLDRSRVFVVVVVATTAELIFSTLLGVYDYRLGNLPLFVPAGHGLVYLAGYRFSQTRVARVQPAKLVRGLAAVVEGMGVRLVEGTTVTDIRQGGVSTDHGNVTAPVVLRCTEGFTATLPGQKREWLPLNSAQIATPPLPPELWREIGWNSHEIVGDFDNAYCYCQRTREGRITVGARGVPYRFGSAIDSNGEPDAEYDTYKHHL